MVKQGTPRQWCMFANETLQTVLRNFIAFHTACSWWRFGLLHRTRSPLLIPHHIFTRSWASSTTVFKQIAKKLTPQDLLRAFKIKRINCQRSYVLLPCTNYTHIHMHAQTHTYIPTPHLCIRIHMHVQTHTHTYTCMHIYTHTRTHTYSTKKKTMQSIIGGRKSISLITTSLNSCIPHYSSTTAIALKELLDRLGKGLGTDARIPTVPSSSPPKFRTHAHGEYTHSITLNYNVGGGGKESTSHQWVPCGNHSARGWAANFGLDRMTGNGEHCVRDRL